MESVCIVWVKGSNEMVFQELDYSHFVDNDGLREVNEVTWKWISESNYMIKVEVAIRCCPTKLVNKYKSFISTYYWSRDLQPIGSRKTSPDDTLNRLLIAHLVVL